MVSVRVIFLGVFYFFKFSLLYFWGIFNKAIIPPALVGYEMIIANSTLCASISYPTRACGIMGDSRKYPYHLGIARERGVSWTGIPKTWRRGGGGNAVWNSEGMGGV